MTSSAYFAALNRLEKLTPLRFAKLLAYFHNDAEQIWRANITEWMSAGLESDFVAEAFAKKATIDPDIELKKLEAHGVTLLAITDPRYPSLLREIYAPPPVLLVRGTFPLPVDEQAIAVVGTRVPTMYGRQVTTELTRSLASTGIPVVSGLATGVDAIAHETTVESGGRTIAVLGSGVDEIYPPQNKKLAERILSSGGAIISEYPLGTKPTPYNFPQRNRIIAGLVRGVLVTEGKEKSGSLITAELALEFGREVFAVPGSIFSANSIGPNRLISSGARMCTSAEVICDFLNIKNLPREISTSTIISGTAEEVTLLRALSHEPTHIDDIARSVGTSSANVNALLSLLEMRGRVKNLGGMQWVKV